MDKSSLLLYVGNHLGEDISLDDLKKELENYICLLTRDNANLVEDCISRDSNYNSNKMQKILTRFGIYRNNSSISDIYNVMKLNNNLNEIVWEIAVSNSIQGKTQNSMKLITDYILSIREDFYIRLQNGDLTLVQDMVSYVISNGGKRYECSWCSKICKYLNEYLFDGDKYFIYDGNVKSRLNDYRKYYNLSRIEKKSIEHQNQNWYINFYNALNDIKTSLPDNLKRSEIDHIMWAFQKYPVQLARFKS